MATCLAKFAMRVSRGPGCCSAVKLKCIIPIPISTTPDTNIVQMIRDRMRFSFAAGDTPPPNLFCMSETEPKNTSSSKVCPIPNFSSPRTYNGNHLVWFRVAITTQNSLQSLLSHRQIPWEVKRAESALFQAECIWKVSCSHELRSEMLRGSQSDKKNDVGRRKQ